MKFTAKILVLIIFILLLMIYFSPLKKNTTTGLYVLEESITINKPTVQVFDYLGNSAEAGKWSVFVSHITPLNSESIHDGKVGSIRRCFKNKNEKGMMWDEEIIKADTNPYIRELSIFNMRHFMVQTSNLLTRQQYEPINSVHTKLTLGLYKKVNQTTTFDIVKMKLAGYVVAKIFKGNLRNIKKRIESDGG